MQFWNTKKLADRLSNNEVSEKEKKNYFLILSAAMVLASYSYAGSEFTYYMLAECMIMLMTTIIGFSICYKKNKSGDDKNFIERCVIIGFPIALKVTVLAFASSVIVFSVIEIAAGGNGETVSEWAMLFMMLAFSLLYYARLYKWIGYISIYDKK